MSLGELILRGADDDDDDDDDDKTIKVIHRSRMSGDHTQSHLYVSKERISLKANLSQVFQITAVNKSVVFVLTDLL